MVIVGLAVGSATVLRPTTLLVAPPLEIYWSVHRRCRHPSRPGSIRETPPAAVAPAAKLGTPVILPGFKLEMPCGARDIKARRRRDTTDRCRTAAARTRTQRAAPLSCSLRESLDEREATRRQNNRGQIRDRRSDALFQNAIDQVRTEHQAIISS